MKKKLLTAALALALLAGCGNDKELTAFNDNMSLFYTNISSLGESLSGIVPEAEDAAGSLLSILDALETEFAFLAGIEVPTEFADIEEMADDAYYHMGEAALLYHQAYESEEYDDSLGDAAAQHYEEAMKRVSYIASLLQGEIPQGEDVIVTQEEGTEFAPYGGDSGENDG